MLYIPNFFLNSPTFGIKHLPCRRFLQHYYRGTFIESHRKPTDVPEISLFSSMLALIPQSGDFSGATLGVRSIALLQVPKLTENFTPDFTKCRLSRNFLPISLYMCKKMTNFAPESNLREKVAEIRL